MFNFKGEEMKKDHLIYIIVVALLAINTLLAWRVKSLEEVVNYHTGAIADVYRSIAGAFK